MFVQKYCWQKICICDILREKLNLGVTHQINIALRYFFTLQTYIWPKIHSKLSLLGHGARLEAIAPIGLRLALIMLLAIFMNHLKASKKFPRNGD